MISQFKIQNEAEKEFVLLFNKYLLHEKFILTYENRIVENPDTHEISLPDFEIVAKIPEQFMYTGAIIELTTKRLDTPKKKRQRRAVTGWLKNHPDYFSLEYTYEVLKARPDFVHQIYSVFMSEISPASLQGKISATILQLKHLT